MPLSGALGILMKILTAVLFLTFAFDASSCSCFTPSEEEVFENSNVVFIAKVMDTKLYEDKDQREYVIGNFKVIENLKGKGVEVKSLRSNVGSTCEASLVAGHFYLIYSDNSEIKTINACTRSRWINIYAEEELLDKYREQ